MPFFYVADRMETIKSPAEAPILVMEGGWGIKLAGWVDIKE